MLNVDSGIGVAAAGVLPRRRDVLRCRPRRGAVVVLLVVVSIALFSVAILLLLDAIGIGADSPFGRAAVFAVFMDMVLDCTLIDSCGG